MFRPKRKLLGCRVLVTGASSGIGRALALELSRRGVWLMVTARRQDRLVELVREITEAGGKATLLAGDIIDPGHQNALVDAARDRMGGLDVVVNNAGVGGIGTFASASEQRLRDIMEVNFFAVANMVRLSIPLLRESRDPAIVNVGSVLGHCAVPGKSEYCASKFALHGWTDALRIELARESIEVILASPSATDSEFFDHAIRSAGDVAKNQSSMSPERVALQVIHAIEHRKREVILSWSGMALVWADRLVPSAVSRILRRFG